MTRPLGSMAPVSRLLPSDHTMSAADNAISSKKTKNDSKSPAKVTPSALPAYVNAVTCCASSSTWSAPRAYGCVPSSTIETKGLATVFPILSA